MGACSQALGLPAEPRVTPALVRYFVGCCFHNEWALRPMPVWVSRNARDAVQLCSSRGSAPGCCRRAPRLCVAARGRVAKQRQPPPWRRGPGIAAPVPVLVAPAALHVLLARPAGGHGVDLLTSCFRRPP